MSNKSCKVWFNVFKVIILILKISMNSNPIFDTTYGLHFFCNSHSMYLHSVMTSLYSSFHCFTAYIYVIDSSLTVHIKRVQLAKHGVAFIVQHRKPSAFVTEVSADSDRSLKMCLQNKTSAFFFFFCSGSVLNISGSTGTRRRNHSSGR